MSSVRLQLRPGHDAWVEISHGELPGPEGPFVVHDQGGRAFSAAWDELAEAIECATGVHAGRAERLAEQARAQLAPRCA